MQDQSLCTSDADKKRGGFRRSLEDVWWQFCSATAPPSTKSTLQLRSTTMPCQNHSCTCNSRPLLPQHEGEEWDRGAAVPQEDGAGAYYSSKNHTAGPHRDMTSLLQTVYKHLHSWLPLFSSAFFLLALLDRHSLKTVKNKLLAKWNFTAELQKGKGNNLMFLWQ